MAFRKLHNAGLAVLLMSAVSCTSVLTLEQQLSSTPGKLGYIHDSKKSRQEKKFSVAIDTVINDSKMPVRSKVIPLKGSLVPLIVINVWNKNYEFVSGKNQITNDVTVFVKEAFTNEINRSTSYRVYSDSTLNSDVKLKIEVQKLEAKGPYRVEGYFIFMFFFYTMSEMQYAGPGEASSKIKCTLYTDDKILMTKTYENTKTLEPITSNYASVKKLRKSFSINLVEALSLSIKENVDKAALDIETYIENEIN